MQTIAKGLALVVLIAGTVASSSVQAAGMMAAPSGSDKAPAMMQGEDTGSGSMDDMMGMMMQMNKMMELCTKMMEDMMQMEKSSEPAKAP